MSRRKRLLLLLVVGLVATVGGGLAGRAVSRARQEAAARRTATSLGEIGQSWAQSFAAPDLAEVHTYAAVHVPGTGAVWAEALIAAGVPRPRVLATPPDYVPAGWRLLITAGLPRERARALAAAGRAVIHLGLDDATPATAESARLGDAEFPLLGEPVAPVSPEPGATPLVLAEGGIVLGAVRREGEGLLIDLGMDLARLLLRWRQGDPARGGQDTDGNGNLQPRDLLPPLPPRFRDRPFADEVIDALLAAVATHWPSCRLPRTAGLPEGATAAVVITADQDYADDMLMEVVADRLRDAEVPATFLLTDPEAGLPPDINVGAGRAPWAGDGLVRRLLADGFDLGLHPYPREAADVGVVARRFQALAGFSPLAARNHRLRWPDALGIARASAVAGLVMNLDYMVVCDGKQPCAAFDTGSVRAMPFFDEAGRPLPLLLQPTVVDDFSLRLQEPAARSQAAAALSRRAVELLPRAAAAGGALFLNAHPVLLGLEPGWLDPLVATRTGGTRFFTAAEWLDFLRKRRRTTVDLRNCRSPSTHLEAGVRLRR